MAMNDKNKLCGRFRISCEFLNPNKDDWVLSVGCGEAEFEKSIKDDVEWVIAIDNRWNVLSQNMGKIENISFEIGNITEGLKFLDNFFDKIIMLEVLEHLPKGTEEKALRECYRLLNPGGILVLSTPNNTWITKLFDPAWWLRGHRHYEKSEVTMMLHKNRFIIENEYMGGGIIETLWIPVYYLLLRLRLAKYIKPFMDRVIDWEYKRSGFYTIIIKARK